MSKRAVVLLSGGLDSATVLAIACSEGFEVHALTVEYGQRHDAELAAAKRVAKRLGAASHRFASASLRTFGGSALTDDIDVPKGAADEPVGSGIPVTYVPARNTVLLSLALAYAESIGAHDLFIGVNAVDYSGYPDCRPAFVEAFERLANVATKIGVEGETIRIHAPLMNLSKADIIRRGLGLRVDYGLTLSCYDPLEGRACGGCDACRIRRSAFAEVGIPDPGATVN